MTVRRPGAEHDRLASIDREAVPWKRWGPYLSERQWGTVREDYSESGNAWEYLPHDHARSRAYRWGEDGLAGISDERQALCFAVTLWNGRDAILKERLFGLTNGEGSHGEDVKEYYYYLDNTPTHSWMKYLQYPQAAFPYTDLIRTNGARPRTSLEYELLDTGVFDANRYFDVFVEYAKDSPDDILIQITVCNRGPEAAVLHVLPTLWFRNTWSWGDDAPARPHLRARSSGGTGPVVEATHALIGTRYLYCDGTPSLLFTENDTNLERIFGAPNLSPYVKDGIERHLLHGHANAVNPAQTGTKATAVYPLTVEAGGVQTIRLRLTDVAPPAKTASGLGPFGPAFTAVVQAREREADEFYGAITPSTCSADQARVMRQALAGMLWSKQFYYYDVDRWLKERGAARFGSRRTSAPRNGHWYHMVNSDVISMPDKWEYPWYAAWDTAFHVLALSLVDVAFAKQQLSLMLHRRYQHPNGQIPAYEWNFGDVNPPVHAWATYYTYQLEKTATGGGDVDWLESSFQRLTVNFTWWVNRKDREGRNVFEGGFLGLDNIGVFDRSSPLPTGGHLEQADGTAWMAFFSLNMLQIAVELSQHRPIYLDVAQKFFEHFMWIAASMTEFGAGESMWDEEDGFFYDVLRSPDGRSERLKVRSMVGLLPLCAVAVHGPEDFTHADDFVKRIGRFLKARPELIRNIADPTKAGFGNRRLLSILDETRLRRVLAKMLDEREFLSPYGIRSLSRYHQEHPYVLHVDGREYRVDYAPAESTTNLFGGNSNWRGPVWIPVNALIIRALLNYYRYYGNDFTIECPTGSGRHVTLFEVAKEISRRLTAIFAVDDDGRRPVFGGARKFQDDPHWKDCLLFYEYFHGDNGAGLGASHQTGWTGVVARLMHLFETVDGEAALRQ